MRLSRSGLQFFYRRVLARPWDWVHIVKPPRLRSLPDILSVAETVQFIEATRRLRFRVFFLTTNGLRLGETLALEVGDIDAGAARVPVRNAKGGKERFVPLSASTQRALRRLWPHHRHPRLLFPNARAEIAKALGPMDRGGV